MDKLKKLRFFIFRRMPAQFLFFILQNPLIKNFFTGNIYQGNLKMICTPGLNCYSCPAAITSCPVGAMQNFLAGTQRGISMFAAGFLLTAGVVFGRFICGYVCPMGLLQDLMYKIKSPKLIMRLRYAKYIKYIVLVLFVIALPYAVRHNLSELGEPWFCKYICPSGTIFGALPLLTVNGFLRGFIGLQFYIKAAGASFLLFAQVFVYRIFCRTLCPLGAVYSLFNKIAFLRMHHDKSKCSKCGACAKNCAVCIDPVKTPNSPECVRCGKCKTVCREDALNYFLMK